MLNMVFLGFVNQLLQDFPMSVSSVYRTVERNRIIGGAKNSAHLRGLAIDLIPDQAQRDRKMPAILRKCQNLGFTGIEWDIPTLHLHVDMARREAPWHVVNLSPTGCLTVDAWIIQQRATVSPKQEKDPERV